MKSHNESVPFLTADRPAVCHDKLLSSIVDVVCLFDEQGFFRYVSPLSVQLFGYHPEEMIDRSFRDFIHPDDLYSSLKVLAETANAAETSNFENRYIRKNGSVIPVIWSRRWDETERLFYCVGRDGTEKMEIEQRLLKAQRMARVANYEFDVRTQTYSYASDTLFEIFGLDRAKYPVFTSELFWSLVHPDDHDIVKKDVLQLEVREKSTIEYRIVRPDGKVVHVNRLREVICNADGKPAKTIGTIQDISSRKAGERALQQSEERFRSLVQHSNDLLGVVDTQGNYRFVGENVQELLGYRADELVGTNCFPLVHPEDFPQVENALKEIETNKSVTIGPYRFKDARGEWRWLETIVSNHLQNPAINGLVINSRDVNEKKQKEEQRKSFEERLQRQNQTMIEVLEQMRDGFLTISLEGKVVYWNRQAELITGRSREEMLGKNIWELFPGLKETPFCDLYHQLMNNAEPVQKEVFSPYGKRWTEMHAYRTQTSISVFFRDTTEKQLAEEEMRRLSLIAKKTNNPVIVQDSERRVQWVNDAFMKISGYSFDECIGRHIEDVCDGPETDPETLRYIAEKVSRKEPFRIEALNYKKNGETYWSDVTCQPIFNEAGDVVQFFSIATDITERKKLEAQLKKEQKERQAKIAAATLKAQETERSIVGQELHDNVNQVLTTVKLYAEMCRDGMGDTRELMERSIQLLQKSITEIRGLSKRLSAPSLGKIKLVDSIKELITAIDMTQRIAVTLNTGGIESLEVEQEIHLAVYRILQEQLTNILKHANATCVEVTVDLVSGYLNLHVKDDGKGFDPLCKSSGIGITNMVTRAESLGGSLRINSAPGKGCELLVIIPMKS